jgi:hypothetical protein
MRVARRFAVVVPFICCAVSLGACGRHEEPGTVTTKQIPADVVQARARKQAAAGTSVAAKTGAAPIEKSILFGDLHVHTTFSADAFLASLPLMQGEGTHPPADACDFARFCSQVDFWSINDHAEAVSPQHWRETKEAIRQCNAVAGDAANPDVVAFLGWEWTQVGLTPDDHYGHKNVIFRETAEDKVPKRPISALNDRLVGLMRQRPPLLQQLKFPLLDFRNRQRYLDFGKFQGELAETALCPRDVATRELPEDCSEVADTPEQLFDKLSQWGFESMVIPHGNTWGLYTPRGSTWDKQLTAEQHDPDQQRLIEIYSGHGNSEEYRDWRAVRFDADGKPQCPEPTDDYLPCCWQAGEIVRSRCGDASPEECERRVASAQINFLMAGPAGRTTLPGVPVEEWLDCEQCRDCFLPSFAYRPGGSTQYAMAISNFDDPANVRRFRFGFIASSDNHTARPGTGYKEYDRRAMTEATGPRSEEWRNRLLGGPPPTPGIESIAIDPTAPRPLNQAVLAVDFERQASFFQTGGLVAVHSERRDRGSIWNALKRREVYGTSGERILLWFDLLNGASGTLPMGSETAIDTAPRFRVRAVGAYKQLPGCPEFSTTSLSQERLEKLCHNECYNPSDERRLIQRIEVIRIRPQIRPDEPVATLIEDPWRRFACPPDPAGCVVEFEDPEMIAGQREVVYYVRAIQEATPAVNGGGLRCRRDASGQCLEVNPCYGDYRTSYDDDCLTAVEERAWSSPIFVRPG